MRRCLRFSCAEGKPPLLALDGASRDDEPIIADPGGAIMSNIVQGYPVPGNWRKPLEQEEEQNKGK
ncbi:MAG: hypothetical protein HUJ24_00130 [Rhodobacteraceae bacterium]|nr:hypothetical protein [Paracoccaceae bacterium]